MVWVCRGQALRPVHGSLKAVREPLCNPAGRNTMSLGTILLIVLILMLIGAIPTWGHSRSWGYAPSGGLGLIELIIVVLLVMGRL